MKHVKSIIVLILFSLSLVSCAQDDPIIGVWNVKNEYNEAIYEIVEYQGKFFGKIHYYNNGKTEYKGDNNKEDYFLTDVELIENEYTNGKMYMPDGRYYQVLFELKNNNTLLVKMTIQGEPYTETWVRNTTYK